MITKVTKGVKISIKTAYEGSFYRKKKLSYAFTYEITIENHSDAIIQIDSRFWKIFDSTNGFEFVQGEGIVGQQPILYPDDSHTYRSGCVLESTMGTMEGNYTVNNLLDNSTFKVLIPRFQLIAPFSMN
ncbi:MULTISPECIES: Co2+/Mg2+ efflux protein ApaG [Myroides]|uniref:Co2+/Mg2+ efflux protein ApaG n=1 Tax=Myroides albus TaxID=2562892 RepID=A0A6I3LKB3_9FLAO|nr:MULTISPECIES: Co2+/Mg2+ efflux protein ApaG [Myroides]MTG96941.1 Co2+/Mg2+ efflux protein ApaG [Myroides albus]MVX35366.1 Co2+/Mg2+ efflux protein ApaG [Myroides sp. LoEW2-1]UVD78308.1 Co2+/Mg2+ efflux protein ApaG [Myroides albus]